MKSTTFWGVGLAVFAAVLLQPPWAWGQLRIRSGAVKRGVEHPRALEKRIFQLTNEARRKNGLPALAADNNLATLAQENGENLSKSHRVSHTDSQAKRPPANYGGEEPAKSQAEGSPGENIHMGLNDDYSDIETAARLIVNTFMGAPGTRGNILNPAYKQMGVVVSIKGKESYVVQEFGPKDRRFPEVKANQGEK
jgi:uncharacterized protein YkwD